MSKLTAAFAFVVVCLAPGVNAQWSNTGDNVTTGTVYSRGLGVNNAEGTQLSPVYIENSTRNASQELNGEMTGIFFKVRGVATSGIGSWWTGTNQGAMTFRTTNGACCGAGWLSERMRITHDGKVGIGTPGPLTQLHVKSVAAPGPHGVLTLENPSTAPTAGAGVAFRANNDWTGGIQGQTEAAGGPGYLTFLVSNTMTERMRLTSQGRLGIGTSVPATTLHVAGSATIADHLTVGTASIVGGLQVYNGLTLNSGTLSAPVASFNSANIPSLNTPLTVTGTLTATGTPTSNYANLVVPENGKSLLLGSGRKIVGSNDPAAQNSYFIGENGSQFVLDLMWAGGFKFYDATNSPAGGKATLRTGGGEIVISDALRFAPDAAIAAGEQYAQTFSLLPQSAPATGTIRSALYIKNAVNGAGTNMHDLRVDGDVRAGGNLRADGNLGVGTAPSATKRLYVVGDSEFSGNASFSGNVTGGVIQAKYQDVAEWVSSNVALLDGEVVILDAVEVGSVSRSTMAYHSAVAGVVSPQPGVLLGEAGPNKFKIATTGRVKVKVDATTHAINVGDLLVTSDTPGVAMKSIALDLGGVAIHRPGTILGKAIEPLASGSGEIMVLLSLQ